jgi:hypothetical protein
MFGRYSERAQRVIILAQDEARRLNYNYVGTEHLLLGLVREGEGVGAQVLIALGTDLSEVREQVLMLLRGTSPAPGEHAAAVVTVRGSPSAHFVPSAGGPRCPGCRLPLEGHVGYRVLRVPRAEEHGAADTIEVGFVYCLDCGTTVAPSLATGSGVHPRSSGTGDASVPVQLSMDNRQLVGTAHGEQVRLDLGERSHDMTVTGMFAGAAIDVRVLHDDNFVRPTGLTARLHGSFEDQPVELRFGYDLEPSYLFHHGEVRGVVAGCPIEATVRRTPGSSTSTVSISGTWGNHVVQLHAGVSGDLRIGHIRGTFGRATVGLSVTSDDSAAGRAITITGLWDGPLAALALAVGAIVNFM